MGSKVYFFITILCLQYAYSRAFVLNKRAHNMHNDGANKLAEALKVIQTQKRTLDEAAGDGLYQKSENWDYPYGLKGGVSQEEPLYDSLDQGYEPELSDKADFGEDYYGSDYPADSSVLEKLMDYYYDTGYGEDVPVAMSESLPNLVQEADEKEIHDILDTKEGQTKKNINWTPKALGFEGLKHKRKEDGDEETEDTRPRDIDDQGLAVVNGGSQNLDLEADNEDSKSQVTNLTDEEVQQLLSDANNAEVKSISHEVNMQNINGKQTISGSHIVDFLKDDDKGNPKEMVIETKVPQQSLSNHLNKELLVQDVPIDTEHTVIQKRAGDMFLQPEDMEDIDAGVGPLNEDEANVLQDIIDEPSIPSESDLFRECLLKYIELEDRENTALAEALNWATKAQYDKTDTYIPMQVEYLRNAVDDEQTLVELRRRCFGLAENVDQHSESIGDIEKRDEDFPLEEDLGPVIEDNDYDPFLSDGGEDVEDEMIPSLEDLEEAYEGQGDPIVDEANSIYDSMTDQEIAQYIADELKQVLLRKGVRFGEPKISEPQYNDGGDWLDGAVNDDNNMLMEPQEKEYHINPFLRELIENYRRGKLDINTASNFDNELSDYDYGDNTDDMEEYVDPFTLEAEMCPAVNQLTDNCAYADALDWTLDNEALQLCNRHQLCYSCGVSHEISPSSCDEGFLGEAYMLCKDQINEKDCVDQAELLFDLMFKTHVYVTDAPSQCQAQCTVDYIKGNSFKKK